MIISSPVNLKPLLASADEITAKDVLNFRQEVFRDGLVSKHEADAIFMINEADTRQCDEWHDFFVEALTDFTVHQSEPRGYISVENAEWLMRQVSRDGIVKNTSELELLIKTIEKASSCPQILVTYILQQIAHKVLGGGGELIRGVALTPGIIGEAEAELMRRVLFSVSGADGIAISRQEAEVLFDLNDRTVEQENHPSWSDLFVKAIANHLMAVSGYQPPSRQEAFARQEAWQETDNDVTGTLRKSLASLGSLFSAGGLREAFKSDHNRMQEAWRERNDEFEKDSSTAQKIAEDESHWLLERIGRDGIVHENELALLQFLKEDSPDIHPSLRPLLDKVA